MHRYTGVSWHSWWPVEASREENGEREGKRKKVFSLPLPILLVARFFSLEGLATQVSFILIVFRFNKHLLNRCSLPFANSNLLPRAPSDDFDLASCSEQGHRNRSFVMRKTVVKRKNPKNFHKSVIDDCLIKFQFAFRLRELT